LYTRSQLDACFEAEIDFAGGDVLTRVPSSNLGKQITGATTLAHGCDKYPKSFIELIDMFVGCGRVTSKPEVNLPIADHAPAVLPKLLFLSGVR
jgi:hypothetical protein